MKISKQYYFWAILFLPFMAEAQNWRWQRFYNQVTSYVPDAVPILGNQGYVMTGSDFSTPPFDTGYGFTFKVDRVGNLLWNAYDTVCSFKLIATQDSGFLTSGYTRHASTRRAFVQKLDKNGSLQWRTIFAEPETKHRILSLLQTADSNYLLYGLRNDSLFLRKINRTGNIIWQKIWKDTRISLGELMDLIELSTGGFAFNNGGSNSDSTAYLIKTDALGNILWRKPMGSGRWFLGLSESNGIITYLDDGIALQQLDGSGNLLQRRQITFAPAQASPRFAKRRLGGFWLSYIDYSDNDNHHLLRLDAQLNVLNDKIIQPANYIPTTFKEISDTSLFYGGFTSGWGNIRNTFLMVSDTGGRSLPNLIRGKLTSPCSNNGFKNWLVGATRADGITFFAKTDTNSRYEILTDIGVYTVRAYPASLSWGSNSAVSNQTQVGRIDTIPLIINCLTNCPDLNVDISTPILRRCFPNEYFVNYCNHGTIPATGAYVEVKLDSLLQYLNANIPLTSRVGQLLRFNLGTVQPNDCRTFTIGVQVACGDSTRLGQSLCTDIRISPDTICGNVPTWNGANLRVQGTCERDSVHFTIYNTGRSASSTVRRSAVENANLHSNTLMSVGANAQLHYRFPANGNTWRMSVEQEPNHPYGNSPVAVVEGCRNNQWSPIAIGFLQQLPLDTRLPTARTYCLPITGSFDPNDKMSFPAGYGANRQIEPNQDLEYMIRFQNTGTDTAFTVVIKDTLSNGLDAASIKPLAASHRYEWTILKNNVLQFTFPNLLLVDSFRNEPKSHGFIKFHIKQKLNVVLGSKIYNSAAIYFDYNAPVITNRTMLTVGKQFIVSGIANPTSKMPMRIHNYPNPTVDRVILELLGSDDDNATRTFQLYDATGRVLRQANFNGNRYEWERDGLNTGFYLFRVTQNGQLLGTGNVVIQAN